MQEEMTRKVASLESQMDARVNKAVQLALSQRGTAGSYPDVVISPVSLTAVPTTTSFTTVSAGAKGHEYSNSSCTRKRKEKDIIPHSGWTLKKEAENERKKIDLREDR